MAEASPPAHMLGSSSPCDRLCASVEKNAPPGASPMPCVDAGNSAWHAMLDSLCSQTHPAPLAWPPTTDSQKYVAQTQDTSLCSTHVVSTAGSCSPLTSSALSVPTHPSCSLREPCGVPRPPSPIVLQSQAHAGVALPPPLLISSRQDAARPDDLDPPTPSTTTLVPRSTLSSAFLGPHALESDRSFPATPPLTAEEGVFCLTGEGGATTSIPPELCATLAAHDACDDLFCRTQVRDAAAATNLTTAMTLPEPEMPAGHSGLYAHDQGLQPLVEDDCTEARVAWRPSTFATVQTSMDGEERTPWQALVIVDTNGAAEALIGGATGHSTPAPAPCSTFYDLYHAVNRTAALSHSRTPATPLSDTRASAADPALPRPSTHTTFPSATVELEKVMLHGRCVSPHTVGELCSFVMEDDTVAAAAAAAASHHPPAVPVLEDDGGGDDGAGLALTARPGDAGMAPPVLHVPSTVDITALRRNHFTSSVPPALTATTRGDLQYFAVKTTADSTSLPTTSASQTSSFSFQPMPPMLAPRTEVSLSDTSTTPEEKPVKPRGVLSVQNLREHKARLSDAAAAIVPAPPPETVLPVQLPAAASYLTGDTVSSLHSGPLTTYPTSRRSLTGCLKATRLSLGTPTLHGGDGVDDAFKKCQFLCLNDVKDAVTRSCSERAGPSPTAPGSSPSPELSLAVDAPGEPSLGGLALPVPSLSSQRSPAWPSTPVTSLTQVVDSACSFPSMPPALVLGSEMDKHSALRLAAAFTEAHLSPSTVLARSPDGAVLSPLGYATGLHSRSATSSTILAGSAPDRVRGIQTTSSLPPLSASSVAAGADVDEHVNVSFSLRLSTRHESGVSAPRIRDPLEHKVRADFAACCDDDSMPDEVTVPETTSRTLCDVPFQRSSFALDITHMTPSTDIWMTRASPDAPLHGNTGKFATSQGTTIGSLSAPLSSVDSRHTGTASFFVSRSTTVVIDVDLTDGVPIGRHDQDSATADAARSRRMYCHPFESELAEVAQLEKWARRCAFAQDEGTYFACVPVTTLGVKQSNTEVTT